MWTDFVFAHWIGNESVYMVTLILSRLVSLDVHRPAIHLLRNTQKRSRNAKNEKCIALYFVSLFSLFAFGSILRQGWHSHEKSKDFVVYFLAALIKHEIRVKYEKCIREYFVFCGVFCENICKISAKHEIWKVHRQPWGDFYQLFWNNLCVYFF